MNEDLLRDPYEKAFPHTHGKKMLLRITTTDKWFRGDCSSFHFPVTPHSASRSENKNGMALNAEPHQSR